MMADEWKQHRSSRGAGAGRGRGRGRAPFGRGFAGKDGNDPEWSRSNGANTSYDGQTSWRWNASYGVQGEPTDKTPVQQDTASLGLEVDMVEKEHSVRKRLAADSVSGGMLSPQRSMVVVDPKSKVSNMVEMFDGSNEKGPSSTPQKNANRKKHKGEDDGVNGSENSDNDNARSAALFVSDRRAQ